VTRLAQVVGDDLLEIALILDDKNACHVAIVDRSGRL
jgi:hypothetical protein